MTLCPGTLSALAAAPASIPTSKFSFFGFLALNDPYSLEADDQVRGVPGMSRRRKDNRLEALLFYRTQHGLGEVYQKSEEAPAPVRAPAAASTSGARRN